MNDPDEITIRIRRQLQPLVQRIETLEKIALKQGAEEESKVRALNKIVNLANRIEALEDGRVATE